MLFKDSVAAGIEWVRRTLAGAVDGDRPWTRFLIHELAPWVGWHRPG